MEEKENQLLKARNQVKKLKEEKEAVNGELEETRQDLCMLQRRKMAALASELRGTVLPSDVFISSLSHTENVKPRSYRCFEARQRRFRQFFDLSKSEAFCCF